MQYSLYMPTRLGFYVTMVIKDEFYHKESTAGQAACWILVGPIIISEISPKSDANPPSSIAELGYHSLNARYSLR